MGLRNSFTCPYEGQAFSYVKKWLEAQISGILPHVFSYTLYFERGFRNIILAYKFTFKRAPGSLVKRV